MRVDKEANELLYGEGTSPAAILHGHVAHPQNLMAPLLKVRTQGVLLPFIYLQSLRLTIGPRLCGQCTKGRAPRCGNHSSWSCVQGMSWLHSEPI